MKGFLDVTEHGVIADGITGNTAKINELIQSVADGGVLYFPPGRYVTGPILLKSNITLHIAAGAVILGSEDKTEFPLISQERLPGYGRGGRLALITAFREENITIEGGGMIDGRGQHWWETERESPQRPRTIQPILCTNVKIRDITIVNSPMWTIHPLCCKDVFIQNVRIKNPWDSPNTDGINPESCCNVHISGCNVDVGDDCITIKSGEEDDALQKQYPCQNITVSDCCLLNGHGGIVIGSEMSGGVRRVVVTNCVFKGTDRGLRIKTRRGRGGRVSDILVNNLLMEEVLSPFTINGFYFYDREELGYEASADETTPVIENISISNFYAHKCKVAAIYILGLPEMPVRGISMSNVQIHCEVDEKVKDIPVMTPGMEQMQGSGIFLDNVENSCFENVRVTGAKGELLQIGRVCDVSYNGRLLE